MMLNIPYVSLSDLFLSQVQQYPDKSLFTFLDKQAEIKAELTFLQLAKKTAAIAKLLTTKVKAKPGDKIVIAYPPNSIEFIPAFLACVLTGIIAVPIKIPHPKKLHADLPQFKEIVERSQAKIALTTKLYKLAITVPTKLNNLIHLKGSKKEKLIWPDLNWLTTDKLRPVNNFTEYFRTDLHRETIAYLQFTSGSTSKPKGVILTHGNLLANLAQIKYEIQQSEKCALMCWVPLFYDTGLIGGVLNAIHSACPLYMISPLDFLEEPKLLFEAIAKYKVTDSVFPNFGYEYCLQKINLEEVKSLDLSAWKVALQGGEFARLTTISQFFEKFKVTGLKLENFYNLYGMAESALYISGGVFHQLNYITVDKQALETKQLITLSTDKEKSKTIISVGKPNASLGIDIIIVNPKTGVACQSDEVGEIWLSSPSIGLGYWGLTEAENNHIFRAQPAESSNNKTYFRTGDMGFYHEDELFICGRLKEMIIVGGRNLYSQDIEQTVAAYCPEVNPDAIAAFSIDHANQERLIVITETTNEKFGTQELINSIQRIISMMHQVSCFAVVVVKKNTIPKTASGKVQRFNCRMNFLENTLHILASSSMSEKIKNVI